MAYRRSRLFASPSRPRVCSLVETPSNASARRHQDHGENWIGPTNVPSRRISLNLQIPPL
jgi:hypothetical protein